MEVNGEVANLDGLSDLLIGGLVIGGMDTLDQLVEGVDNDLVVVVSHKVVEHASPLGQACHGADLDGADNAVAVHEHGGGVAFGSSAGQGVDELLVIEGVLHLAQGEAQLNAIVGLKGDHAADGVGGIGVQSDDFNILAVHLVSLLDDRELAQTCGASGVPEVQNHQLLLSQNFAQGVLGVSSVVQRSATSLAVGSVHSSAAAILVLYVVNQLVELVALSADCTGVILVGEIVHNITDLKDGGSNALILDQAGGQGDVGVGAGQGIACLYVVALGSALDADVIGTCFNSEGGNALGIGASGCLHVKQSFVGVEVQVQALHSHTTIGLNGDSVGHLAVTGVGTAVTGGSGGIGCDSVVTCDQTKNHNHGQNEAKDFLDLIHFFSPVHFANFGEIRNWYSTSCHANITIARTISQYQKCQSPGS